MESLQNLLKNLLPPRRIDPNSEIESTLIKEQAHKNYHDTIFTGEIQPLNAECSFCILDRDYFMEHRDSIRRKIANLPDVKRTFDSFKVRKGLDPAIRLSREFCKKMDGFLILYGPPGVGKSHLLQAIGEEMLNKVSFKYTTVDNLLSSWRSLFSHLEQQGLSFEQVYKSYADLDLLLLDDLGSEKPSEWSISVLTRLIDTRQTNNSATAITTNLDDGQLGRLSSRLADRIYAHYNTIVVIDAESYRRKGGVK